MRKNISFILAVVLTLTLLTLINLPLHSSREQIVVARVIDGDTLELQDKTAIRLKNINTPEKNEYGYEQAKNFLKNFENKTATIEKNGLDKYGRTLAKVYAPEYLTSD